MVTETTVVDEQCVGLQDDPVEEEFDSEELYSEVATKAIKPVPTPDIEYAPQKPVKRGTRELAVVRIGWSSGFTNSIGSASKAGRTVANNYERLSGGVFKIVPKAYNLPVPWPNSYKNVKAATSRAKGRFKSDWYAILTGSATGVSHAGGNTAVLLSPGAITHEVGHLIGLGHANRFELDKKFKGKPGTTGTDGLELDLKYFKGNGSADGSSVMSTFGSSQLTAPQLYSLGWLAQNQVALHKADGPAKTYNLQLLTSAYQPGYVKSVLIPGPENEGRDIFLSAIRIKERGKGKDNGTRPALTLHLGNPGSMRVTTFGAKPLSFRGVTFEAKERDENNFVVEVRPFVPKVPATK